MKIEHCGSLESRSPAPWHFFFKRPCQARFKRAYLTRTAAVCLFVAFFALSAWIPAQADEAADRRAAMQAQFARAESLRETLEAKPERERSLQEYTGVAAAYRRVYLITPRAAEVPTAIKQVAELYAHMGEQFDPKYFRSALTTYEFLVREYPESKYVQEAHLAIAALHKGPLNEPELAKQAYEDFLQQHPRSSHAQEAKTALAEITAAEKQTTSTVSTKKPAPKIAVADEASATSQAPARTFGPTLPVSLPNAIAADTNASTAPIRPTDMGPVRVLNAVGYTRVIIDLASEVKYQAARISSPDRVYFDIENATLNARMAAKAIEVPTNGYLKSVRVAQNRQNVARIVLELNKAKDYSVFELENPNRLVVDVYGDNPINAANTSAPTGTIFAASTPPENDSNGSKAPAANIAASTAPLTSTKSAKSPRDISTPATIVSTTKASVVNAQKASVSTAAKMASTPKLPADNTPAETAAQPPLLSARKTAELMGPATVAEPVRAGGRSLTRVLGLKVGRIVIDPGHGGHDTGTIGPTGLMEKDLCLDVALRLGKIIQQRLPLAEIVYTREDDSYVALEQRTAMANDARADLLISIHANSSDDHKVRGIETYYLNFNAAPAAMEVAARENALAQGGVHQLEELVAKIARNEKIEESRDLASSIQESLTKQANANARNRGVRKAPFVVLIGANMPSVLTEISFLSNPVDEQWLKKPDNRQKVAEGVYHGIEGYLKSTNSLARNLTSADTTRDTPVSPSQSRQ